MTGAWTEFIKELDRRSELDWFTTLTFRKDTHPESAYKAYRRWEHQINRKVYGVRYTRNKGKGLSSIVALEYQRRGVIHFHALNAGTKGFRRMTAMDWWYGMAGIARIWPFRRNGGAEAYVSKYVVKGGDIFLSGPFRPETVALLRSNAISQEGGKVSAKRAAR